jgi:hypothetical protein
LVLVLILPVLKQQPRRGTYKKYSFRLLKVETKIQLVSNFEKSNRSCLAEVVEKEVSENNNNII